jgi:hypothetical protein
MLSLLKSLFFGWWLLFDRLPTRKALNHRDILVNSHDLACIFCFHCDEDCVHLFFHCSFSKRVWDAVFTWVGKRLPLPGGALGWNHFSLYGKLFRNRKGARTSHLIWLATTWNLWKLRNDMIFKGVIPNATKIVEDIKSYFWLRFCGHFAHNDCISLSDWCHDPMCFIIRS